LEELEGRNVPVPIELDEKPVEPRFKAGDVMPNGTVFDPAKHRIFKNGTVYDMERKRIVCAPSPEHAPITKSNARARALERWNTARTEFAAGLADGTIHQDAVPLDAWRVVGQKSGELLMSAKSARGFADLARFAGEAAGYMPTARGREEMQDEPSEQPMIVNLIFQYIASKSEPPRVIDVD
jgi:hypothetical protein